jgi:hypothetical protein
MTNFQKMDRCLHLAVARPLALALYGTWRGLRLLAAGARRALEPVPRASRLGRRKLRQEIFLLAMTACVRNGRPWQSSGHPSGVGQAEALGATGALFFSCTRSDR